LQNLKNSLFREFKETFLLCKKRFACFTGTSFDDSTCSPGEGFFASLTQRLRMTALILVFYSLVWQGILRSLSLPQNDGSNRKQNFSNLLFRKFDFLTRSKSGRFFGFDS